MTALPPAPANDEAILPNLWRALSEVEDPEVPVSVVDMGLIVGLAYGHHIAHVTLTYTAMGCPAMDMIQDDIRARLLREPGIDGVEIQVVWDPVWTPQRLSAAARSTMRELGIAT